MAGNRTGGRNLPSGFHAERHITPPPPQNFDYGQKQIDVVLRNIPKVKAHITINHRLSSNSTVRTFQQWEGRPRRGQAGDTTLAAPPDQIYQHFYKTANTNLWCLGFLSSAWSLRLTVDIPGFVAGTATQMLLQRSVLRRGGKKEL